MANQLNVFTTYSVNNTAPFSGPVAQFSEVQPPPILGMLEPPPDRNAQHHVPDMVDNNGQVVINSSNGLTKRRFPSVPDTVAERPSGRDLEMWFRLHKEFSYRDVNSRVNTVSTWSVTNKGHPNKLNMARLRDARIKLNCSEWSNRHDVEVPSGALLELMAPLTPVQVAHNTTWLVTQNGIHPPGLPDYLLPWDIYLDNGQPHQPSRLVLKALAWCHGDGNGGNYGIVESLPAVWHAPSLFYAAPVSAQQAAGQLTSQGMFSRRSRPNAGIIGQAAQDANLRVDAAYPDRKKNKQKAKKEETEKGESPAPSKTRQKKRGRQIKAESPTPTTTRITRGRQAYNHGRASLINTSVNDIDSEEDTDDETYVDAPAGNERKRASTKSTRRTSQRTLGPAPQPERRTLGPAPQTSGRTLRSAPRAERRTLNPAPQAAPTRDAETDDDAVETTDQPRNNRKRRAEAEAEEPNKRQRFPTGYIQLAMPRARAAVFQPQQQRAVDPRHMDPDFGLPPLTPVPWEGPDGTRGLRYVTRRVPAPPTALAAPTAPIAPTTSIATVEDGFRISPLSVDPREALVPTEEAGQEDAGLNWTSTNFFDDAMATLQPQQDDDSEGFPSAPPSEAIAPSNAQPEFNQSPFFAEEIDAQEPQESRAAASEAEDLSRAVHPAEMPIAEGLGARLEGTIQGPQRQQDVASYAEVQEQWTTRRTVTERVEHPEAAGWAFPRNTTAIEQQRTANLGRLRTWLIDWAEARVGDWFAQNQIWAAHARLNVAVDLYCDTFNYRQEEQRALRREFDWLANWEQRGGWLWPDHSLTWQAAMGELLALVLPAVVPEVDQEPQNDQSAREHPAVTALSEIQLIPLTANEVITSQAGQEAAESRDAVSLNDVGGEEGLESLPTAHLERKEAPATV